MYKYEHHKEPLISQLKFVMRLARHFGLLSILLSVSLFVGTLGYHFIEGMGWIEAFYNASLIMSGMGPAEGLVSDAGRLFASLYALYSGFFLVGAVGFLLAPVFHRVLHVVHLDKDSS